MYFINLKFFCFLAPSLSHSHSVISLHFLLLVSGERLEMKSHARAHPHSTTHTLFMYKLPSVTNEISFHFLLAIFPDIWMYFCHAKIRGKKKTVAAMVNYKWKSFRIILCVFRLSFVRLPICVFFPFRNFRIISVLPKYNFTWARLFHCTHFYFIWNFFSSSANMISFYFLFQFLLHLK